MNELRQRIDFRRALGLCPVCWQFRPVKTDETLRRHGNYQDCQGSNQKCLVLRWEDAR